MLACFCLLFLPQLHAKEDRNASKKSGASLRTSATCLPSSASAELDINNVRALLMNGGDMWWDLVNNPRYEIPKVENPAERRYSLFAGALWIGGLDEANNMKIAAQTYRQSGNDFWPGPLTDLGAQFSPESCEDWDVMYKVNKSEIDAFRNAWHNHVNNGGEFNLDEFPNVKKWPGYGRNSDGIDVPMADFVNVDANPYDYNPAAGDYPDIRPFADGGEPDQAIWWVINDKGDVHTSSGGLAIGLEIQIMAFAFQTSNAINDMTFYRYRVINKSTDNLNQTFIGQWVDADLGYAYDDYVGCDIERGLGYTYNGEAVDGTAQGYGANPPAVGVDFFQGPEVAPDSFLDMTRFVYYDNNGSLQGNPEVAAHFYGYLRGFWKDGSPMTYGGNGYGGSQTTDFMFPGDPAGCRGNSGNNWSEVSVGNDPYDRRFLQSAGPFELGSGQQMDIHTGVVWARAYENANLGSICALFSADDIAQALFDSHFKLLDGPDAPDIAIEEYNQELIISWDYDNPVLKNNYHESYSQVDPVLASRNVADPEFDFQGYIVFQLKDATVSATELFNTEKARQVAQCDIKDGISTIVNREEVFLAGLSEPVITDHEMVKGEDKGIFNSVRVKEDLFAEGSDRRLKNYHEYHYTVIAYAYNDTASDGRRFVQGNRYFQNVKAMPHKITFENMGTVTNADYGDGIRVTQISGLGNGGNFVQLDRETELNIVQQTQVSQLTYQPGAAPVTVKVVNPKEVHPGDYRLEITEKQFTGLSDTIRIENGQAVIDSTFVEWILLEDGQPVYESTYIQRTGAGTATFRPEPLSGTERVIKDHGISIAVRDVEGAGFAAAAGRDAGAKAAISFVNPSFNWLSGLSDEDDFPRWNWILAGKEDDDRGVDDNPLSSRYIYDPESQFEELLSGSWAPFCLARSFSNGDLQAKISPGVGIDVSSQANNIHPEDALNLNEIPDVDIVLTLNKDLWSKCVVVETAPANNLGSGAHPMAARWAPGIDKNGTPMAATPTEANQGWSWFPGYAIDVNTGRRLNIFFGESSWDRLNNGDDLLFNPTSNFGDGTQVGGRHFVYVSNSTYDGCIRIQEVLSNGTLSEMGPRLWLNIQDSSTRMHPVWENVAWAGIPMASGILEVDHPENIPTETRISLRVNQPFRPRAGSTAQPVFTFSTDEVAAQSGVKDLAEKSLMEDVRIVPNPYYAHSDYEKSQLQTIVKLTNLPFKCKIRIFTLSGLLVRTFNKESDDPEQRWDLKNQAGVPVASGVYIIHVDGFDLGETVVKFFTVMPQADLAAY